MRQLSHSRYTTSRAGTGHVNTSTFECFFAASNLYQERAGIENLVGTIDIRHICWLERAARARIVPTALGPTIEGYFWRWI